MNLVILALPLNLNLIEVLIHLFNITILIIVIRVFFYKPIHNFMDKRAAEFKRKDEERELALAESNKMKSEYETLLKDVRQEGVSIKEEALQEAKHQANEIVESAKKRANEIVSAAKIESQQKTDEEIENLKSSITDLACTAAEKILKREVNGKDIDRQIDDIVKEWKNN